MHSSSVRTRRLVRAFVVGALAIASFAGAAHGAKAGDIAIGHPWAAPSLAGTTNGVAYLADVANTGAVSDRLLGASTRAAARVELHTMALDTQGVMRMREIDALDLAPKAKLRMRPGAGPHLMLMGLKAPLKEGDSFPMTLRFERGGTVEVQVVVERPNPGAAAAETHRH
ncbi:MAG: copper chaperone PCu(A)C [Caldimonas sp.]